MGLFKSKSEKELDSIIQRLEMNIRETTEYLELFLRNLLLGENNELKIVIHIFAGRNKNRTLSRQNRTFSFLIL